MYVCVHIHVYRQWYRVPGMWYLSNSKYTWYQVPVLRVHFQALKFDFTQRFNNPTTVPSQQQQRARHTTVFTTQNRSLQFHYSTSHRGWARRDRHHHTPHLIHGVRIRSSSWYPRLNQPHQRPFLSRWDHQWPERARHTSKRPFRFTSQSHGSLFTHPDPKLPNSSSNNFWIVVTNTPWATTPFIVPVSKHSTDRLLEKRRQHLRSWWSWQSPWRLRGFGQPRCDLLFKFTGPSFVHATCFSNKSFCFSAQPSTAWKSRTLHSSPIATVVCKVTFIHATICQHQSIDSIFWVGFRRRFSTTRCSRIVLYFDGCFGKSNPQWQ